MLGEKAEKVIFDYRHSAMYSLMTSQPSHFVFPAVHLWEPDSDVLMAAVIQWEPELANSKSESFYVAVHGHSPTEMCGGKAKGLQLCHMAFFKPQGIERENFYKKWNKLYANQDGKDQSPSLRPGSDRSNDFGAGGIRPGKVDFLVSGFYWNESND